MKLISASVGKVGSNRPQDVITIKKLLNSIPYEQGGTGGKLTENGSIRWDDETVAAITRFQQMKVPGIKPDGVVNPGRNTWKKLIELSGVSAPQGRTVGDIVSNALSIEGDPVNHPNYIQNVTKSVGIPIWGGNFWLYHKAMPNTGIDQDSVQIPRAEPHLTDDPIKDSPVLQHVFKSRKEAEEALKSFGLNGGYAYFVGPGGHYYPTVISDTSAPALCETMRRMLVLEKENAQAAANLSVELLLWYAGARYPLKTAKPATAAEISSLAWRRQAKWLVEGLKKAGKPVKVNLAGAGEVADAINVNKVIDQQVKGIPNLIRASAEEVATIFEPGVVDQVISNNVVRGQVNWIEASKGAFAILKRGGSISIAPYAGALAEHLTEIANSLRAAGFKDVAVQAGRFVTAVKP